MKLHSDILTEKEIWGSLDAAKASGSVAKDVYFVICEREGSRSRQVGYEIQLGSRDKTSGPTKSRRFKNSGNLGADTIYAASYDEWGWFIAQLFSRDEAAIFGGYKSETDFHEQTSNHYKL